MRYLVAIILCVITAFLTPSYLAESIRVVENAMIGYEQFYYPGIGAAVYVVLWVAWFRTRKSMWGTFEHELTHAIACILCFKKVRSFQAADASDAEGTLGQVTYDKVGGLRGIFISLAPYFLSIYAITVIIFLSLVHAAAQPYFEALLGVTVAYHAISLFKEIHFKQTDLTDHGLIFSLWLLTFANLLTVTFLLQVYMYGWGSGFYYLKEGFIGAFDPGFEYFHVLEYHWNKIVESVKEMIGKG